MTEKSLSACKNCGRQEALLLKDLCGVCQRAYQEGFVDGYDTGKAVVVARIKAELGDERQAARSKLQARCGTKEPGNGDDHGWRLHGTLAGLLTASRLVEEQNYDD
jgi:hypothetical protein